MRAYTLTFVNARRHTPSVMTTMLALLGVADLATRWGYTRQGVHQLAARPGFPEPVALVNGGRTRVWLLTDIEAFEQGRPELGDQVTKRRKQRGYHLARMRGR